MTGANHPRAGARPRGGRAQVPDERHRARAASASAADQVAGLSALGPPTDKHVDCYVDTPDAALAEAGYAGRLRTSEAGTIITLKGLKRADGGGAAHRREELEGAADTSLPPAERATSAARDRVAEIVGERQLEEIRVPSGRSATSGCSASTAPSWSCRSTTSRCLQTGG